MLVGMSRSGTQRLLGRSRQLLRIARTPVFPERDLEESLQRILAIARMQLTVQGGPNREAEHRQRSGQEGTAPASGSDHVRHICARQEMPQASQAGMHGMNDSQNTGVST